MSDNGREKVTYEGLGDDKGGAQLEIKERTFEPT